MPLYFDMPTEPRQACWLFITKSSCSTSWYFSKLSAGLCTSPPPSEYGITPLSKYTESKFSFGKFEISFFLNSQLKAISFQCEGILIIPLSLYVGYSLNIYKTS